MAKASDNVFPRVIQGLNTADQAAPSDSSWRVYAKANGIFARSSNSIVGPFGTAGGGGGSVATDTIWDTKGDLAAATGADAASKLAAGTNGLVLTTDSAQTTGLKWAVPTVPTSVADSTGDVNLTTDTPADATSVTLTLTGTYLLLATVTLSLSGSTTYGICYLTDSSNVVISEGRATVAANSPETIHAVAVIVTASSTTYKVRGQVGTTTAGKILRFSEGSAIGTRLTAIRLL